MISPETNPHPAGPPDAAILIINWNTRQKLAECLTSLQQEEHPLALQIIVVDNASTDGSSEMVQEDFPHVQLVVNSANTGFVSANNQAFRLINPAARYVLLLNSDAALRPQALATMIESMDQHRSAGACGPLTLNTDGTLQPTWSRFPAVWNEMRGLQDRRFLDSDSSKGSAVWSLEKARALGKKPQQTDWLGGSCLLVRREALHKDLGNVLLDPAFQMYCEETDLCWRLKQKGWHVLFMPHAEAVHHGGQSSRQMPLQTLTLLYRSKVLFFRKNYGTVSATVLRIGLTLAAACKWVLALAGKRHSEKRIRQAAVIRALWK